jgi:hypothetical protein
MLNAIDGILEITSGGMVWLPLALNVSAGTEHGKHDFNECAERASYLDIVARLSSHRHRG